MAAILAALQQRRAEVQQRVAALAAIETSETQLTAEQVGEFDTLKAEFDQISQKIDRQVASEAMAATTATPLEAKVNGSLSAQPKQPYVAGMNLAITVASIAHGGKNKQAVCEYAESVGYPDVAAALNKTTPAAGGYIVPPGYVAEMIDLLRPASVVRASGVRSVPMPSGKMNMGRQNGAATATYQGEGVDILKSEQTFGDLNLTAKKLTALVPVSNDLIRYSNPAALQIVLDDMRNVMALREDLAFLRDNGTGDLVKGLRFYTNAANIFPSAAVPTLTTITQESGKAKGLIKSANVPMVNPGWIFHSDVEQYLTDLRDGNGNIAFPEMERGLFRGLPFKTTNQLPVNLGAGTNETEVYLCEFSQAMIGDSLDMIMDVSQEASYIESATLVSAFSRDQTVVRTIAAHDFALRHDKAAAVITGIRWRY